MSFEIAYTFTDSESESESESEEDEYDLDVHQDIQDNIDALWIWIRIITRHLFPNGLSTPFTVTE